MFIQAIKSLVIGSRRQTAPVCNQILGYPEIYIRLRCFVYSRVPVENIQLDIQLDYPHG